MPQKRLRETSGRSPALSGMRIYVNRVDILVALVMDVEERSGLCEAQWKNISDVALDDPRGALWSAVAHVSGARVA